MQTVTSPDSVSEPLASKITSSVSDVPPQGVSSPPILSAENADSIRQDLSVSQQNIEEQSPIASSIAPISEFLPEAQAQDSIEASSPPAATSNIETEHDAESKLSPASNESPQTLQEEFVSTEPLNSLQSHKPPQEVYACRFSFINLNAHNLLFFEMHSSLYSAFPQSSTEPISIDDSLPLLAVDALACLQQNLSALIGQPTHRTLPASSGGIPLVLFVFLKHTSFS